MSNSTDTHEFQRRLAELEDRVAQREAELAIINSVQAGLASKLDMQAIYDLIGDKLREIFVRHGVQIRVFDEQTNTIYYPYAVDANNLRLFAEPDPLGETGFSYHVLQTRQPLLINEDAEHRAAELGSTLIGNITQYPPSMLYVPILIGERATGLIGLWDSEREHSFSDSDVNLVATVASSMGVALENARLFAETQRLFKAEQQRAAELAIINSVQQGLASKLDFASIIDLVGDKVREIFDSNDMSVALYDRESNQLAMPYFYEDGKRYTIDTTPLSSGLTSTIIHTRKPLMINENQAQIIKELGGRIIGDETNNTDLDQQSYLGVPILKGNQTMGVIALYANHTHAFTEAHLNLLYTMTSAMSVALENARLFDETQRLLKITEDRAAELAVINSIQQGLAAELDFQAIVDLVGDKLRDVLHTGEIGIRWYEPSTNLIHYLYEYEHGKRIQIPSQPPQGKTWETLVNTRKPIILNTPAEFLAYGTVAIPGTDRSQSCVYVPIVGSDQVLGTIITENYEKESAYTDTDIRLLTTVASSMGVALENARLYQEIQRRAQEMATLAEIGSDIAASRDLLPVLTRIASHAKDLLHVRDIAIYLREPDGQTFRAPVALGKYINEITSSPVMLGQGISGSIAQTGIAEMVNQPMRDPRVFHIPGTGEGEEEEQEGLMAAPLISRGQTTGLMTVWRPHTDGLFVQAELDFLVSVARQAAIAIESARLYLETQRRANEMAALAEVGREISATLELPVVLERIASRARDLLAADTSAVYLPDVNAQTLHAIAAVGDIADEIRADRIRIGEGIIGDLAHRRAAEFINDTNQDSRALVIPGTAQQVTDERLMVAPLLAGERLTGMMAVWRTGGTPFAEADLNFLIGLARQAAIALENARLFNETTQRAAELSTINSLGQALASQLEPNAIMELVGDKLRELFGSQYIYIALHDKTDNLIHFPYYWLKDHRELTADKMPYGGLTARILESRQPQLINHNWVEQATALGAMALDGELPQASLGVPILLGEGAIGVIMLQSTEREERFSEADVRLLTTIAANVGIAIQTAQLYEESQRRTRQSIALNDLGREISTSLDLRVVLERIAARALELLRARDAVIRLLEPDGSLPASVALGKYSKIYKSRTVQLGQGLTGHIAEEGQAEVVNNPITDPRVMHVAGTESDEDREAMLFAPLLLGSTVIGILVVWRDKIEHGLFEQADLEFAIGLARQAAISIQNARLFTDSENQRQYFEALVQFSPAAIATTSLDGKIVSWNPAAERLFGYTQAEALGHTLEELIATAEEARADMLGSSRRSLFSDRVKEITRRNRKDGSLVDVEQMAVAVRVDGTPRGILAIYHDVTELQRARREAESANVSKSAFLATMSHEIRTPMNGIIGMTGLLLGTELSVEQREFTEVIRNSGETLLSIINDILDFSKIESGKMDMEHQPFDLRDCVESAFDLVATAAAKKNLDLAYLIEEEVPAAIVGDVTRVRQVLLNLLSNAIKFTESGEVVVTVALRPMPKPRVLALDGSPKYQLHFSVRDTGVGIPSDRLDQLFQSFSQLDSSTARKYGGTGLGLAISRRLSELMGGTMWVVSDGRGHGSTFNFTVIAASAPPIKERSYLTGEQPQLHHKQILIVDDNPTNRRILTLQAQRWGMSTRVAASPRQVLDWVKAGEQFDLAILDMHMPEMDGVALAHEIRHYPVGKSLPLVLFSSLGRREVGADPGLFAAYLTKPLKQSQLFDTLISIFSEGGLKSQPSLSRSTASNSPTDFELGKRWPLRILLAEDNVVNQMLAQRLLNQMGYRADVVANGNEAIEAVARQQYDVVLMDVQMPEMDGLEATRQIVARWPVEQRPRIVAMTANAMQGDREMCIAAGMNDYISKPIRVEELVQALRQSLPVAKA